MAVAAAAVALDLQAAVHAEVGQLAFAAGQGAFTAGHWLRPSAWMPDVNYVGGSRQLRRRVTPGPPPAMAGGGDSEK